MEALKNVKKGDVLDIDFSYRHPFYREMYPNWVKNRDFTRGSRFVKSRTHQDLYKYDDAQDMFHNPWGSKQDELPGTAYLPVPSGMEEDTKLYRDYVERVNLYNASGMTLRSFSGMLYRKPPVYQYNHADGIVDTKVEEEIKEAVLRKVTPDNKSFSELCREVSEEVITTNKVGILVDFPATELDEKEMSVLEYEEMNLSPKSSIYRAESIINWHAIEVNNETVGDYFVLDESGNELDQETLVYGFVEKYRVLFLIEDGDRDYIYKQIVVRKNTERRNDKKGKFIVEEFVEPLKEGRLLNRIPFYVLDRDGLNFGVTEESLINDLVDVNIGHYRNSADLEHNLFFLGLKTLVLPGYNEETHGKPTIGGIITGPKDFSPELIEPSSDSGIEKEMINKEARMAVLGAQAISQRGKYVQSAATAKINSSTETSLLASLAYAQSNIMSTILNLLLGWSGYKNIKGFVHINTDFFDDMVTPESVIKWTQLKQSGGISPKTWYYNLEKRDIFPPDWSLKKEMDAVEDGGFSTITDEDLLYRNTPLLDPDKNVLDLKPGDRKWETRPEDSDRDITDRQSEPQEYNV